MRFEKVRDVLDHAREFHHQVSACYQRLARQAANKRVRLMLEYMSQHEQGLENGLAKFTADSPANLLDAWFKFTHDESTLNALRQEAEFGPDMTLDDAVNLAMQFDNCLLNLYLEMARAAESTAINELFVSLLELEKAEKLKVARNALMARDM